MAKQSAQLKLSPEQLQGMIFHQDPMAGFGVGNELQQSRIKLLLACPGYELLETYRFGRDIRLIINDQAHKPIRYTIEPDGSYYSTLIPTL